jgi:lysozyme family protein
MMANFPALMDRVLEHEGGYGNHPRDPGKATNRGVTQAVYDDWRELERQPNRSVKHIAMDEVRAIYRNQYWDLAACDRLPSGLDYTVFDFAVNSGVRRSVRGLQTALAKRKAYAGSVDGIVGMRTLLGIQRVGDDAALIRAINEARLAFLKRLSTWDVFGRGWSTRVVDVTRGSLAMLG